MELLNQCIENYSFLGGFFTGMLISFSLVKANQKFDLLTKIGKLNMLNDWFSNNFNEISSEKPPTQEMLDDLPRLTTQQENIVYRMQDVPELSNYADTVSKKFMECERTFMKEGVGATEVYIVSYEYILSIVQNVALSKRKNDRFSKILSGVNNLKSDSESLTPEILIRDVEKIDVSIGLLVFDLQ
jgi:hypothetical protein